MAGNTVTIPPERYECIFPVDAEACGGSRSKAIDGISHILGIPKLCSPTRMAQAIVCREFELKRAVVRGGYVYEVKSLPIQERRWKAYQSKP